MDKMQEHQPMQQQMEKMDADLLVPVQDNDPMGNRIYHPIIGRRAVWWGLIGGILMGFIFWMIASGHWPITGLGQISSAQYGAAAFMGFCAGGAIGALAGAISGLCVMLRNDVQSTPETKLS